MTRPMRQDTYRNPGALRPSLYGAALACGLTGTVVCMNFGCRPVGQAQQALDQIEEMRPEVERRNAQLEELAKPHPGDNASSADSAEP